jgi:hypothetical protein
LRVVGLILGLLVAHATDAAAERARLPAPVDATGVRAALAPKAARPRAIHLWASWCKPCVVELAALLRTLEQAPGVDAVFLSADDEHDAARAAELLTAAGKPVGVSLRARSNDALSPIAKLDPEWHGELPSTWVIGGDGALIAADRGVTDFARLQKTLDRIARPVRGTHETKEERR